MELDKRNAWVEFFASYNHALGESFDTELEGIDDPEIMDAPGFDDAIRERVLQGMEDWYIHPLAATGGSTPREMVERIDSLDEAMEIFLLASSQCDEELPDPLRTKLGTFGTDAIDRLLPLLFGTPWDAVDETAEERPDEMLAAAAGLRLLGDWGAADPFELILSRFVSVEQPDEMICEAFVSYCNGIGPVSAGPIADMLFQASAAGHPMTGAYEYLVIALSEVGRKQPSDHVFLCLRECFRKMERKVIGAICLGDYGDGRAIPALKGYVDRHIDQIDRQLYYEILSSIKRLGGDVSDMRDPFGGSQRLRNPIKQ